MRMANRAPRHDHGFSMLELMAVVAIIGIIVAMAVPVYVSSVSRVEKRTCFANQRTLEGAAEIWLGSDPDRSRSSLAGVVDGSHPIVVENIVGHAPRCPSAPKPVDVANPTQAEGAYVFTAAGTLEPCPFGALGAHGKY
jgi:prepilin-type N-terminal cleavage/methylation domain-containing protein